MGLEFSVEYRTLKRRYRSRKDHLPSQFFLPCLKECQTYKRAVGYFTTGVLGEWIEAIDNLVRNEDTKINLIISPVLSNDDRDALVSITSEPVRNAYLNKKIDEFIDDIIDKEKSIVTRSRELLLWLIAREKLEIRFAFLDNFDDDGMYHEKIGVFYFRNGDIVAFEGSANETTSGYIKNKEKIVVFRSWINNDFERLRDTEEDFDDTWNNIEEGVSVIKLSERALSRVVSHAPSDIPNRLPRKFLGFNTWNHQNEAIEKFLQHKHGVLEMATGTGKTRIALEIISHLLKIDGVNSVIVTTDGRDLLAQWHEELVEWIGPGTNIRIFRQFGQYKEMEDYCVDPENAVLIVSRQNKLSKVLNFLDSEISRRTLVIHDEVHGLGSEQNIRDLKNLHKKFIYKLGLSATPEREYDDGTMFILESIGDIIYKFDVKDAIQAGILCEFDYIPIEYDLSENDRQRIRRVYSQRAARRHNGTPMTEEEFRIKISKVYKTAENKPHEFANYLAHNSDCYKNSIIFIEEIQYAEPIFEILHQHTNLYRKYFADDDAGNLRKFSNGEIDSLVTCHKISQGIDITRLDTVILFASARAKLETIQRIGRCLRINPNDKSKRATVIDFVIRSNSNIESQECNDLKADESRKIWLTKLSKVRKKFRGN